jgi:hypothetical protein
MKAAFEISRGGIRIRPYCKAHEAEVRTRLAGGACGPELLETHWRRLLWMQHERLIHLLVTALTAVLLLFSIALFLLLGEPLVLLLVVIAFILTAAYLRHYFFLENTVQRWYLLYDELVAAMENAEQMK